MKDTYRESPKATTLYLRNQQPLGSPFQKLIVFGGLLLSRSTKVFYQLVQTLFYGKPID